MTHDLLTETYLKQRGRLLNYAMLRMNTFDAEFQVDELIVKVIQRKKGIVPVDETAAYAYLLRSLIKNINRFYAIKYHEEIEPLTVDEREYWHEFTRNFFDDLASKRVYN